MIRKKEKLKYSRCLIRYESLVRSGIIDRDEAQLTVLKWLDSLMTLLDSSLTRNNIIHKDKWIYKLLYKRNVPNKLGIYLYGGVGTGKSMLMDIFYNEVSFKNKLRIHFHSFMQNTHDRINSARVSGASDPISVVANEISSSVSVLCFDEFQITDIADAMIVGRLFSNLIRAGTFIVTTSNIHPNDLYMDGLNRDLFIPFIELFKNRMHVIELDALKDYRKEKLSGRQTYFAPINSANRKGFDKIWNYLVVEQPQVLELKVKGRKVTLEQHSNGVGRSTFNHLCGTPLGALDYLIICENIKVLFVEEIPILSKMGMDSAKRFVTLIDTLYDNRTQIICLADQEPEMLYPCGKGSFEFKRTVSRLYEMQSEDWISGIDKEKEIL